MMQILLHDLPRHAAWRTPEREALVYGEQSLNYGALYEAIERFASGLMHAGIARGERVAIFLEKRFETVIAAFGTAAAGAVFVPVNPLLKAEQVAYILRDCGVRLLVTSVERLSLLSEALVECPELRHLVLCGDGAPAELPGVSGHSWAALLDTPPRAGHRVIDN